MKDLYEKNLKDKKTKAFYDQLRKVKPYYNHKSWENDYKKQKYNQRFMKQVKYRRPPGFVDPIIKKLEEEEEEKAKENQRKILKPINPPASHIHRVKAQRNTSNYSNNITSII